MPALLRRLINFSALLPLWNTPACTVKPRVPAGCTPVARATIVCSGVVAGARAARGGGAMMGWLLPGGVLGVPSASVRAGLLVGGFGLLLDVVG